jgi:uncharacterized protein
MTQSSQPTHASDEIVTERHSPWDYGLSIILILTFWQIIGTLPYVFLYLNGLTENVYINYVAISISFVVFLAAIIGCVKFVHRRNWLRLVSPDLRIDFRQLGLSFAIWFVWSAATTVLDAVVHPGLYRLTFSWPGTILFGLIALILTPIQTSAEEFFFRGYLLQGLQRLTKKRIVLLGISGLIFAIPHFMNAEMQLDFLLLALFYFGFGVFLTYITLQDGRLEAALGIHAANNLFTVVVANYDGSSLPSPSVFTSAGMDPIFNLLILVVGIFIFLIVYSWLGNRHGG